LRWSVLAFLLLATAAQAGEACTAYENKSFAGERLALERNTSMPVLPKAMDDRISSVHVAPGCLLVGYADPKFKGPSQTWGPGDYTELPAGWDDVVSSLQCNCQPE
jgi:hypothetical protein